MVSLLLCLLDWCMAVPLSILLEPITMPVLDDPASQKAPLLDYIYRVGTGSLLLKIKAEIFQCMCVRSNINALVPSELIFSHQTLMRGH